MSVKKPWLSERNRKNATHKMSHQPTYTAWRSMKSRCHNSNNDSFPRYGGRGISVCESWMENFINFLNDMGTKPKGMQLDRVDNNGNYCKENCRWVTPKENSSNRNSNRFIEFNGDKKTVAEWARVIGISRQALRYRIESGHSLEMALKTSKGELRYVTKK